MISIVACCHGAKLCAHAARDFRSQPNGAVTRMWRSCGVQPSHKERAIGVVRCKKEGMLLQPLRWCCVDCVIHYERDVWKNNTIICVARASNSKRDCDVEALPILTCERLNVTTSVREERLRAWSLLLLAATVRSFAHMPLGISDRNNTYVLGEIYNL